MQGKRPRPVVCIHTVVGAIDWRVVIRRAEAKEVYGQHRCKVIVFVQMLIIKFIKKNSFH